MRDRRPCARFLPRLSAEHPPERSPDPSKHIRDRLRRPLSAPRRPNAATVQPAAICRSVFAPAAWASRMAGATPSANARVGA